MTKLPQAIEALTRVSAAQLEATREEMRRQERREVRERMARPEVQAELASRRRPLRRFSPRALIRAAPSVYAQAFQRKVPDEFYVQVGADTFAVACPCGTDHTVGAAGYPTGAPCGRYFLYDGDMRTWRGVEQGPEVRPES